MPRIFNSLNTVSVNTVSKLLLIFYLETSLCQCCLMFPAFILPRWHKHFTRSPFTGWLYCISINPLPPGKFSCFFAVCWFFKMNFFEKFFQEYHPIVEQIGYRSGPFCWAWSGSILSGIPSDCQTDWIQISPDICRAWSGSKLFAKDISRWH